MRSNTTTGDIILHETYDITKICSKNHDQKVPFSQIPSQRRHTDLNDTVTLSNLCGFISGQYNAFVSYL